MAQNHPLIRVPKVKVNEAKKLQKTLAAQGRYLSLYECLLQVENASGKGSDDPFKRFRL